MTMNNTLALNSSFSMWLCTRRIHRFLKRHFLDGAAHQLELESTVFFDLRHFEFLAKSAKWQEAENYVLWFIPPWGKASKAAFGLRHFLDIYRTLGMLAYGGNAADEVTRMYPLLDADAAKASPKSTRFNALLHEIRHRGPMDRDAWQMIWDKGAENLKKLILKCPELKRKLHLPPNYAPESWQINLAGVRSTPRPYKKKKGIIKPQGRDIAHFFAQKREEINMNLAKKEKKIDINLPESSSSGTSHPTHSDMSIELAILEGVPSAGPALAPALSNPGAARVMSPVLSNLAGPAENSDVSSRATNESLGATNSTELIGSKKRKVSGLENTGADC